MNMTTVAEIFETMDWGPAPESDRPVREWLASHESSFLHYIDGAWREPQDGARFEVLDPATAAGTSIGTGATV